MVSMLEQMDSKVAKKALEQFPNFSSVMKDIVSEFKDFWDRILQSNDDSVKSFYFSCDTIICSLQKELEKSNDTFEEKKYIIKKNLKSIK